MMMIPMSLVMVLGSDYNEDEIRDNDILSM